MNNQERRRRREAFVETLRRHVEEFGSVGFTPGRDMDEQLNPLHDSIIIMAFGVERRPVPTELLSDALRGTLIGAVREMCRERGWDLSGDFAMGGNQWRIWAPVVAHTCPTCNGRGRFDTASISDGCRELDPRAITLRICGQCYGEGLVHSNVAPQVCWLKDSPTRTRAFWDGSGPIGMRLP